MLMRGADTGGEFRLAIIAGVMLGALAVAPTANAGEPPAREDSWGLVVAVRDGLVSLEADHAPLTAVLEAIAEQAEFELSIKGELERKVTRTFVDVPLEEALRRMLQYDSSVLIHAPDGGPLIALRVLPSGRGLAEAAGGLERLTAWEPVAAFQGAAGLLPEIGIDPLEREDWLWTQEDLIQQINDALDQARVVLRSEGADPTARSMADFGRSDFDANDIKDALLMNLLYDDSRTR